MKSRPNIFRNITFDVDLRFCTDEWFKNSAE